MKVGEVIGKPEITPRGSESPPFTPRAKKALELSPREALQLGQSCIGTEDLLLELVREANDDEALLMVLSSLGIDVGRVRTQVI